MGRMDDWADQDELNIESKGPKGAEDHRDLKKRLFDEMSKAYQPYRDAVERAEKAGVVIGYIPPGVRQSDGQIVYPKRTK
jgi:hypothetical protein